MWWYFRVMIAEQGKYLVVVCLGLGKKFFSMFTYGNNYNDMVIFFSDARKKLPKESN